VDGGLLNEKGRSVNQKLEGQKNKRVKKKKKRERSVKSGGDHCQHKTGGEKKVGVR